MIYFTADHHFGHKSILRLCGRPFADVEEMNESLIKQWNDVVGVNDQIYVIGDFTYESDPAPYLPRLRGKKVLIRGNHDKLKYDSCWDEVYDLKRVSENKKSFILLHYAMRTWQWKESGSFHLYGHSHGQLEHTPWDRSMDVGVDAIAARGLGYRPVSIEEVTEILTPRPYGKEKESDL